MITYRLNVVEVVERRGVFIVVAAIIDFVVVWTL